MSNVIQFPSGGSRTTNRHGLPRPIPEKVKREVRQRAKFGCVLCGMSLVDYDHVDPEWADARSHDPNGIALLCPNHHAQRSRGFLSSAAVKKAMAAPKCSELGFSFGDVEGVDQHPFIQFAGQMLAYCEIPIQVGDFPVIQIQEPEEAGAPYRLSASFFDEVGKPSLLIVENEWRIHSSQWDAEVTGGRIEIWSAPRKQHLALRFLPGIVIVEKINMRVGAWGFVGDAKTLTVIWPNGVEQSMTGNMASHCRVGFQFS